MANRKELRLLDPGNFDAYLDFVCAELGLSSKTSVPEGTGEFATNKGSHPLQCPAKPCRNLQCE
jgi:hypothetical protein